MGKSNFSGIFAKTSGYFDGDERVTRDNLTNAAPDLYTLMTELANQNVTWQKLAADGAAATATAEFIVDVPSNGNTKSIQSAYFLPAAALAANDTNYATLILSTRNGLGGAAQVIAESATGLTAATLNPTGNWTAWIPVPLTLYNGTNVTTPGDASLDISSGGMLTFQITKTGLGIVVPAGILGVVWK